MSTQPEDDEVPQYETRSVHLPDGSRVIIAHKPGALDDVTDEELIARHQDFLRTARAVDTPLPDINEADRDNVRNLAQERLLRRHRQPGTPFTADEVAPFLTDPTNVDVAAQMAAVLNTTQEAFRRNIDQP